MGCEAALELDVTIMLVRLNTSCVHMLCTCPSCRCSKACVVCSTLGEGILYINNHQYTKAIVQTE